MNRISLLALAAAAAVPVFGQSSPLLCVTTANPPIVRAEGLAERLGDIVLSCTGGPAGGSVTTNLTVLLSVNVTNHLNSTGVVDALLTIDNSGNAATSESTPANVPATLASSNSVVWQGLTIAFSPTGTANLRIANLRGNAMQASGSFVLAYLALNGPTSIPVTNGQFTVAVPRPSLYASFGTAMACDQTGSPAPSTPSFPNFLAAGTLRAGVRLTEGFASVFAPKSDWSNLNADTGIRVLVRYSGLPGVARLYVPTLVAGSTADIPTSAGDLGLAPSGGRYTPGRSELLLALVTGADANGAGGTIALPIPASQTDLADVAEVPLTDGAGYAVYEVVDSNSFARESVQIPSFVTAPPLNNGGVYTTTESVSLAPVSQATTAVANAPIPRFTATNPDSDCSLAGDCTAVYFGRLAVDSNPIAMSTTIEKNLQGYFMVRNTGGGVLGWTTSVAYANGSGWLRVTPSSGTGNGALVFDVLPGNLTPGTYEATITVSAGDAGTASVPVTLNVSAPQPPAPAVKSVTSAADARLNAAAGSLATLYGTHLTGRTVTVTFDGNAADVLFSNDTQINVRVPEGAGLAPKVVATVDGVVSQPFAATLSPIAPAIFPGAVVNQDGSVNSESNPAKPGTVVVLYGTGASGATSLSAKVHDVDILSPLYGGPAPTLPGVQQVNLVVPSGLPSMQTFIYMCGTADPGSARVCSPAQKIWLQR